MIYLRLAARSVALVLSAVAIVSAGFDWAENAAVASLLDAPAVTDAAIATASRLTVLKSACVTLAMSALVVLLIRAGWMRWRRWQSRALRG